MKTKDRIIHKSVELFNRYGVDSVPLHRIAAELGISPGNLTYHYKTKNDIIRVIYPIVEKNIRDALDSAEGVERPLSARFVVDFQIRIAKAMWEHRFIFISLQSILDRDKEFEEKYYDFHDWIILRLKKLLDDEMERGAMKPASEPSTTAVIAANQWYVWVGFLFFQGYECRKKNMSESELIYSGVIRNLGIIMPYCSQWYAEELVEECRSVLGVEVDHVSYPEPGLLSHL